ncbi:hypothetical protein ASPWEDRAFT_35200 [Aspergillus wentii DTO 134E9]|uniref:Calcineurin-like phosphoesterase domain-containing protein n=1 Tax=Aspergillus wentii DTO 134E9 TaxID=1073089 RepID=A0A1L9S3A4_ASPWE|nr:uncharacterized protein ASPWEDRAFT_35200 [Aspergillus wentii DTO 134E9]KAI9929967.1 hypothetical protein MW887_011777 [Aspergillus wentii]OJJ41620.1 hypothetical protein ASPWEDRAFT_35200 [Aspergillus wentii DTO 134E9]
MAAYSDRNNDYNINIDHSETSADNGFYHSNNKMGIYEYTRPLINYVRDEWQNKAQFVHTNTSMTTSASPRWVHMLYSLVSASYFRRYLVALVFLLVTAWIGWRLVLSPRLGESASLSAQSKNVAGGWFGTNAMSKSDRLIRLKTLDPSLLPAHIAPAADEPSSRRLVFVGDVHGCKYELEKLLEKVTFNPERDHLILAGDMINKGPDSLGVVDLARKYSASCVRGNHEDKVLALRHEMAASNTLADASEDDSRERRLARQFTDEQVKWLDSCPVILRVGQVSGMGEVVVVHGGLVPGVELEKQDPENVMNMLTIDMETLVPSSKREGTNWTKLFNKYQTELYASLEKTTSDAQSKMTTVIYGHDSKRSLSLDAYTKGLDTGCIKGQYLTALVVEDGGKQTVVQVKSEAPKSHK